jgi:transposase-like protein
MSVFKRRRFPAEIILLCVRWYCKYGISYRDLESPNLNRISCFTLSSIVL